jgi:hypothetical protein
LKFILKGIHFFLFVGIVALLSQYLYGWIGFNATDEGFVLSGARRILEGQFTHLDFLSLRPAGSSYLHALVVKYGGADTFYLSRFIFWIQSALIAWLWVIIANKLMKLDINIVYRYLLSLTVFIFNVHNFPAMAWTTVDGIFLSTIGLWLITHFGHNGNQIGYILIGCAAMCKQNFLVLIPGVFIIMGHWRRPYYVLVALLPAMVYGFFIWKYDLINDSLAQVFARNELLETGVLAYVKSPFFFVGLATPVCINIFRNKYKGFLQNIDFILAFDLVILAALALFFNVFIGNFSFALFGFVAGYVMVYVKDKGKVMFSTLALLIAWTASISLGYNTPAIASGILLATLLAVTYNRKYFPMTSRYKYVISTVVLAGLLASFHYTRLHFVYKDNPARALTTDLGPAFYGANKIKTNALNVQAFAELTELSKKYQDSLVIAPDYAAFWVTCKYPNPLNIDWPNQGETQSEYFQNAILENLIRQKGEIVIALQKYRASEMHLGKQPLEDEEIQFPIVEMIKDNFIRIGETEFFYLYQ